MTVEDLRLERTIAAPPAALFDAWLDPDTLARFMCPAPGVTIDEASCDPQVGGAFRVVMKAGDKRLPHSGHYRAIERPNRLAFTWCSATAGEGSLVTLDFAPVDGGTHLTLTHVGLPSASARSAHQGGWDHILETLGRVAA